jgi:hypothetical protein
MIMHMQLEAIVRHKQHPGTLKSPTLLEHNGSHILPLAAHSARSRAFKLNSFHVSSSGMTMAYIVWHASLGQDNLWSTDQA